MDNKYEKFIEDGFKRADDSHGRASLLTSYLTPIVADTVKNVKDKSEAQQNIVNKIQGEAKLLESQNEELGKKIKVKENQKTDNEQNLSSARQQKNQEIVRLNDKINEKRKRVDDLANNVKSIEEGTGSKTKTGHGYYIGIPILIILTIFLWIFYCSALHSALIRDIQADLLEYYEAKTLDSGSEITTNDNLTIVGAIINLHAIGDAWQKGGILGIILLFVSFGLPLAAGFLIYVFKGQDRKIGFVFLGTFLFDSILAYKLVKEIYIARHQTGIEGYEKTWEFSFFYQEESFYMILFIGFIGYVVWGIILNYVLTERDKYEPLKKEIIDRQNEIEMLIQHQTKIEKDFEGKEITNNNSIRQIDSEINAINNEVFNNERLIHTKLQEAELVKSKVAIPKAELESNIESFFAGWCKWIVKNLPTKNITKEDEAISECEKVKNLFLKEIYHSKEYFIIEQ